MAVTALPERRKSSRIEFQGRIELEVPQQRTRLEADSVNLSEAGVCVRLSEALEVRVPVTLWLFARPRSRPVECPGRVAWVVQRLDLRDAPPFLYDVGVEFVNPSFRLRQFAARIGLTLKVSSIGLAEREKKRLVRNGLEPLTIRGRCYEPRLVREGSETTTWHLIVSVDGVPCFSHRYPSEREAIASWKQFKGGTAKPPSGRGDDYH